MMYPCPNVSARSSTTSSPTPGRARRSARRARCRASSRSSSRSTSSPTGSEWIRSRCATRSTPNPTDDAQAREGGAPDRRGEVRMERRGGPPSADAGPVKRGIGVAQSQWVSVIHPPTACEVRITDDGSVEAFTAAQDIGTGTRTMLAQVVAEEFGSAGRPGRQLHRRHALSDRAAVGRQPRHRLADAGGAQRRLPGRARTGAAAGAGARRGGGGRSCSGTGTSVSRAARRRG